MINWKEIQEGKIVEVTEEEFDSFLNALPPKFFKRDAGIQYGYSATSQSRRWCVA